jgi:hypothetical protein
MEANLAIPYDALCLRDAELIGDRCSRQLARFNSSSVGAEEYWAGGNLCVSVKHASHFTNCQLKFLHRGTHILNSRMDCLG